MIANQAKAAAFGGRVDAALGLALESVRIGREHLQLTAAGLSEREALEYAGEQAERLDLALSLAVEPTLNDPTLVAATWDALVRSRGLVLDEMAGRRLITAERLRGRPAGGRSAERREPPLRPSGRGARPRVRRGDPNRPSGARARRTRPRRGEPAVRAITRLGPVSAWRRSSASLPVGHRPGRLCPLRPPLHPGSGAAARIARTLVPRLCPDSVG